MTALAIIGSYSTIWIPSVVGVDSLIGLLGGVPAIPVAVLVLYWINPYWLGHLVHFFRIRSIYPTPLVPFSQCFHPLYLSVGIDQLIFLRFLGLFLIEASFVGTIMDLIVLATQKLSFLFYLTLIELHLPGRWCQRMAFLLLSLVSIGLYSGLAAAIMSFF